MYTLFMEYILLAVTILQTVIIIYLTHSIIRLSRDAMDRLHQKSVGIYRPADLEKEVPYEEQDRVEDVPLEDVSDTDFLEAIRNQLGDKDNG